MSIRLAPLAGMLAFLLLVPSASGQTLFKSTMPDGRIVYGDKPAPGAVKVEKSKIDTSKRGVTPPSVREKAVLRRMESDRKKREAASDRLRRAEIALHDAQVAQSMGKEPQPGERIGTAGGGSRFTDGYWERQKRLAENVEKARRVLELIRAGK